MAYNTAEAIEALAIEIGENIYLDIAKWHLYLGDAKLHTPLAEQLYPLIDEKRISEGAVADILGQMTVAIGGGRKSLPLIDLIPTAGQSDLVRLLEDFQEKL